MRDIPQSIQVVPEEVIKDRNVTELRDAFETVGGISSQGTRGTGLAGETFILRGFQLNGFQTESSILRDGIPYISLGNLRNTDIERIEVLKGPASVLFGASQPGGVVNLVSKKPLSEPFYEASFTAGNFNTYRGAIDLSGPLNESKTVKYRLNLSYENYESFRDIVNGDRFEITPTIAWDISERLVPLILPEGNDLVIDILDATLAFSIRNGVEELNPTPGIRSVALTKVDDSSHQELGQLL